MSGYVDRDEAAVVIGVRPNMLKQMLNEGRIRHGKSPATSAKVSVDDLRLVIEQRDEIEAQLAASRAVRRTDPQKIADELNLAPATARRLGIR